MSRDFLLDYIESFTLNISDFKEMKLIGQGGFGKVYSAKYKNGVLVAIKQISVSFKKKILFNSN